jgi:hypothetical protein
MVPSYFRVFGSWSELSTPDVHQLFVIRFRSKLSIEIHLISIYSFSQGVRSLLGSDKRLSALGDS